MGNQQPVGQAAGVASDGDTSLDRSHASGTEFGVALGEARRVERQTPGDAHECVAVLGQALARRCGVVRTSRVARRTTLLLVAHFYALKVLSQRPGEKSVAVRQASAAGAGLRR